MLWRGEGGEGKGGRGKEGRVSYETEFIFHKESISEVNQNPNIAPTFAFQALDKQTTAQPKQKNKKSHLSFFIVFNRLTFV